MRIKTNLDTAPKSIFGSKIITYCWFGDYYSGQYWEVAKGDNDAQSPIWAQFKIDVVVSKSRNDQLDWEFLKIFFF